MDAIADIALSENFGLLNTGNDDVKAQSGRVKYTKSVSGTVFTHLRLCILASRTRMNGIGLIADIQHGPFHLTASYGS